MGGKRVDFYQSVATKSGRTAIVWLRPTCAAVFGISAMFSFGPLVRFVTGTSCCAPVVARHLARKVSRSPAANVMATSPS
jgi:hypothetical protein